MQQGCENAADMHGVLCSHYLYMPRTDSSSQCHEVRTFRSQACDIVAFKTLATTHVLQVTLGLVCNYYFGVAPAALHIWGVTHHLLPCTSKGLVSNGG